MCGHDGAIFETSKNEPFVFRISTPQSVRFSRALGLIEWSKFVFQSTLVTRNTNCSNFKPIPRLDEIRPFELRNGNHRRNTNALRPRHYSYHRLRISKFNCSRKAEHRKSLATASPHANECACVGSRYGLPFAPISSSRAKPRQYAHLQDAFYTHTSHSISTSICQFR